jgi:HSP20 family protein
MIRTIRFTGILARADEIALQLQRLSFSGAQLGTGQWQPAMNVYLYANRLEVCLDLAGVRKEDIQVSVDAGRLVIRGHRDSPPLNSGNESCARILVMEIPEGGFERILEFRVPIDLDAVTARQDNGFLWITIPQAQPQAES